MSDGDGVSRRGLFRGLVSRRARDERAALGQTRHNRAIPMLRPPGAVEELAFLAGCTRCGECIEVCPADALHTASERFRGSAGTPTFDPLAQPCVVCEDMPCIPVSEPGVLSKRYSVKMGTAMIDTQTCLAHTGTGCSVCAEQCPVPGAIAVEHRRPRIENEICNGCGVCQHVCPAPHNAVAIMPILNRPAASLEPAG